MLRQNDVTIELLQQELPPTDVPPPRKPIGPYYICLNIQNIDAAIAGVCPSATLRNFQLRAGMSPV